MSYTMPPNPHGMPPRKPIWPVITAGAAACLVVIAATIVYWTWPHQDDTADQDTTQPSVTQAPATQASATQVPEGFLGSPITDGELQFVVTGIDAPVSTLGTNRYMRRTAQGEFRVVHVTVTNTGTRGVGFSGRNQFLVDGHGRQYSDDTAAEMNIENASVAIVPQINPGNQISVSLVYDVPAGTVPDHMMLHTAMFTPGVMVSLPQN